MNRRFRDLVYSIPGVIVGAVVAHGCSAEVTPPEPTYADPFYCDFRCPERGVADGNASISGTPSVDGFFASIIRFQTAADTISAGIRTELDAIGASVGARAGDDLDLKDKLDAFLSAKVTGLKVHYQPVRCTLSARAMLAAEAKCDTTFDPAMAVAQCDGHCNVDAGTEADCGGSGTVSCVGTAPDLVCPGTCQGDCELSTPTACSGTCNGTCDGDCTVTNAAGACAGSCDGKCTGRCETDAGATCTGRCTGKCTYTPPDGACSSTAQVRCDAKENATVDCRGYCSGHIETPKAKAECEAQAKVDAGVDAECRPPAIDLSYQLSAAIADDAMATASFQAWLEGFERHVSAILAYEAKIDGLRSTAGDLGRNARSAINDSIDNTIHEHLTLMQAVGLGCALEELPGVLDSVESTGARLAASAKSAIDVLGSLGVS